MFDKKTFGEKPRKHPENFKRRLSYKFARLFQLSELCLPSELQKFVSSEKRLTDRDFSRNNLGKIRVILKINESKDTPSCLTINKSQNCVGLIDPTPSRRSQTSSSNINLFPFDSIFTGSDQQNSLLSSSIIEPILDFFKGKDACIFSFGNASLGKTTTMVGSDQSINDIGIIPCALVWVFKVLEQLKINKKTRYAIRISALEIANKNVVRDMLNNSTTGSPFDDCSTNPGMFLLEKSSSVLNNQKELPAGNLLEAARILDNVLAARSVENSSLSHLQFIIHLYQYQLDSNENDQSATQPVLGRRSRLHFLDLGSGRHGNDDSSILSLQGMSKVILALYTSQRHIPYKDNVLTQVLKDTLNVNTVTTMLVHISNKEQSYNDTLQIVQLASKLYRTRSRKSRSVGFLVSDETSSCSSSSSGFHSRRIRPHMGIGAARRSSGNSSASSELDLTSASELSCCETVIFRGNLHKSESEKSLENRSVNQNLKSGSSESDLVFSDKELSKDHISSSSNILSPSSIRRRKISPRTNARAWPSSNNGTNTSIENAPELWVDGPNAVYKTDQKEQNLLDFTISKVISEDSNLEPPTTSIKKPLMMSKETQCDDIWDSGSSLTDGSSHSNTLDRKEHRPLSDISECTEDTESNVTVETELVKRNIMNEICPINDLDDILESTFGLSPLHHDMQPRSSGTETNYNPMVPSTLSLCKKLSEENNNKKSEIEKLESVNIKSTNMYKNLEVDKTMPAVKNINEVRKHYHSASDSKKSTKSEQKERKNKSKCKKCTKKSSEESSKSMTSSNSTDFSRVASWIQKVEYEIHTSLKDNNEDDVFLDNGRSYGCSQHSHYQSQPNISGPRDHHNGSRILVPQPPLQYPLPLDNICLSNDFNHVRYSLYDGYHMGPIITNKSHIQLQSAQATTGYNPEMTCAAHMLPYHPSISDPPFHSPKMARDHVQSTNILYTRNSVSSTQPPLPPLPQQTTTRDNIASLRNNVRTPPTYDSQRINSSPLLVTRHPRCKTLPRDMYSDPASLKRNKSEIKSRDKTKKESKNFISILFAPFISLRNKMNKSKINIERQTTCSENDTDKFLPRGSESNELVGPEWPLISLKSDPEFILSSPYHLVTPPKTETLPTESSGHGSDCSSFQNRLAFKGRSCETPRQHKCRNKSVNKNSKNSSHQRPTSSGYGSIIIKGDSEVSSHNDSSSEYSISGQNPSKLLTSQSRMKHSLSLSNCKSILDKNTACSIKVCETGAKLSHNASVINDQVRIKNVTTAQDLILQEKLRIALNEERKLVIDYIEVNRMRGLAADASIMNLICFKGVDNFEISNSEKRNECRSIIKEIDEEMEQLKHKFNKAQNNLLLITTFDSKSTD